MIYKLRYSDKQKAVKDLQAKEVFQRGSLIFGEGTHAVVFIGAIMLDDETYEDGFFVDVMSDKVIDFESIVYPEDVVHKFAGNE